MADLSKLTCHIEKIDVTSLVEATQKVQDWLDKGDFTVRAGLFGADWIVLGCPDKPAAGDEDVMPDVVVNKEANDG